MEEVGNTYKASELTEMFCNFTTHDPDPLVRLESKDWFSFQNEWRYALALKSISPTLKEFVLSEGIKKEWGKLISEILPLFTVYSLPVCLLDKAIFKLIGNKLGEYVKDDFRPGLAETLKTSFVRIQVNLFTTKQLVISLPIHRPGSYGTTQVRIKYERLEGFCEQCGIISHTLAVCEKYKGVMNERERTNCTEEYIFPFGRHIQVYNKKQSPTKFPKHSSNSKQAHGSTADRPDLGQPTPINTDPAVLHKTQLGNDEVGNLLKMAMADFSSWTRDFQYKASNPLENIPQASSRHPDHFPPFPSRRPTGLNNSNSSQTLHNGYNSPLPKKSTVYMLGTFISNLKNSKFLTRHTETAADYFINEAQREDPTKLLNLTTSQLKIFDKGAGLVSLAKPLDCSVPLLQIKALQTTAGLLPSGGLNLVSVPATGSSETSYGNTELLESSALGGTGWFTPETGDLFDCKTSSESTKKADPPQTTAALKRGRTVSRLEAILGLLQDPQRDKHKPELGIVRTDFWGDKHKPDHGTFRMAKFAYLDRTQPSHTKARLTNNLHALTLHTTSRSDLSGQSKIPKVPAQNDTKSRIRMLWENWKSKYRKNKCVDIVKKEPG
ncbi:hypothetical protein GIB67_005245 [Kingdonia uniflora]|uniref:Zinc knuckle CX2CX4HX4C domain-containing protein n=1 Tax=Kingdonia uniflora TaxID=39325 RepID=A0A7J7NNF2_9MAGN|nr:hypothetical protein GIB67_005245 [Kingdonia uniflora]